MWQIAACILLRCLITSTTNYDHNIIQTTSFHLVLQISLVFCLLQSMQTKSDICASEEGLIKVVGLKM